MRNINQNIEQLTLHVFSKDNKNLATTISGEKHCGSLKDERRKLYIIKRNSEFVYVGEANCSMKTRIARSLSSVRSYMKHGKARNGYMGYKWLHGCINKATTVFDIYVYIFDEVYDNNSKRHFVEAVEGEIVWLIRKETNQWPTFQNEIHFSNQPGAM